MSMQRCFCSKLSNFGTNFAASRFMPKTSVKICWREWNDMTTSSATPLIVIRLFLHCFNVFTGCWRARATMTIIVIDNFSAFLKPVVPQISLCSAHSRLNISNVFAYLISFLTQNLIQFFWSIFSNNKKSKSTPKNKLTIQNDWYCQHM